MQSLSPDQIAGLLQPYLQAVSVPETLFFQLGTYLDLLLKWNARTNLTSIRDPETIVTRHFGESLFLACHLPENTRSVLDLGSGAGFPGLPLRLLRPDLAVTLAESQHKKAAFLREVIRSLDLSTEVHASRAEDMVGKQYFDVVAMRAVDRMEHALQLSRLLGKATVVLSARRNPEDRTPQSQIPIPLSSEGLLLTFTDVPRGILRKELPAQPVPRGTCSAKVSET